MCVGKKININKTFEILGHKFKDISELLNTVNVKVVYDKVDIGFLGPENKRFCPQPERVHPNKRIDGLNILLFEKNEFVVSGEFEEYIGEGDVREIVDDSCNRINSDLIINNDNNFNFFKHNIFFFSTNPFTDLEIGSIWVWINDLNNLPDCTLPMAVYNSLDAFMTLYEPMEIINIPSTCGSIDEIIIDDGSKITLTDTNDIEVDEDPDGNQNIEIIKLKISDSFNILDYTFKNIFEVIDNADIIISGSGDNYSVEHKSIILEYDEASNTEIQKWPNPMIPFHILEFRHTSKNNESKEKYESNKNSYSRNFFFTLEYDGIWDEYYQWVTDNVKVKQWMRNLCKLRKFNGPNMLQKNIPLWALPAISFTDGEKYVNLAIIKDKP